MCKGTHFVRHKEETPCFFSISYTIVSRYLGERGNVRLAVSHSRMSNNMADGENNDFEIC